MISHSRFREVKAQEHTHIALPRKYTMINPIVVALDHNPLVTTTFVQGVILDYSAICESVIVSSNRDYLFSGNIPTGKQEAFEGDIDVKIFTNDAPEAMSFSIKSSTNVFVNKKSVPLDVALSDEKMKEYLSGC